MSKFDGLTDLELAAQSLELASDIVRWGQDLSTAVNLLGQRLCHGQTPSPPPVFGQRDPQWAADPLGTSGVSIGGYGCAITCVAMVLQAFGLDETPRTVNQALTQRNGYHNQNLIIWEAVQRIWPSVSFEGRSDFINTPAPVEQIDAELAMLRPVIAWLDFSHQPGLQQHFVLLVERNTSSDVVDWFCHDPWHGDRVSVVERYHQYNPARPWLMTGSGILLGARYYAPSRL